MQGSFAGHATHIQQFLMGLGHVKRAVTESASVRNLGVWYSLPYAGPRAPRGSVTQQGVVLPTFSHLLFVNTLPSLQPPPPTVTSLSYSLSLTLSRPQCGSPSSISHFLIVNKPFFSLPPSLPPGPSCIHRHPSCMVCCVALLCEPPIPLWSVWLPPVLFSCLADFSHWMLQSADCRLGKWEGGRAGERESRAEGARERESLSVCHTHMLVN